jgi:hypothetical protein
MSIVSGSAGLPEITENYESIERLVMETPRGRWFLDEFARRQRAKELTLVLDSISRLERAIAVKEAAAATDTLASRIATAVSAPEPAAKPVEENLEARQLRYFKKDEELFQPAPPAAPRAVATEIEKKGAKLVIRRKEDVAPVAPIAAIVPDNPVKEPEAAAPAAAKPEEAPKRRIVIIRHKAGEAMDVPLHTEMAAAS